MLAGMPEWIARPDDAPPDWPAHVLRNRVGALPLALQFVDRTDPISGWGVIEGHGIEMDDAYVVPFATIQAYAIVPPPIDHSDELGRGFE